MLRKNYERRRIWNRENSNSRMIAMDGESCSPTGGVLNSCIPWSPDISLLPVGGRVK